MRLSLALLVWIWLSIGGVEAAPFEPPTTIADLQAYLEGAWLDGAPADRGDCRTNWYDGKTQIEFEFRKSGGRLMIFEPYDLFQQIQIPKIELSGDTISLFAQSRTGAFVFLERLRIVTADELVPIDEGKPTTKLYRCGTPDLSVNEGVSADDLRSLTPATSGALAFPQTIDGVSDKDICEGKGEERARKGHYQGSIQFELLGPVHYWVVGVQYQPEKHVQDLDFVRAVHRVGPGILKIAVQKGDRKRRDGWDMPGASGERYELTIIDKGARFEIPELAATLIRCEPAARGMHRWGQ